MNDQTDTDHGPDHGPDHALPDRAALDPYSAAVLAVTSELERQIPADASVAIDPEQITRAAIDAGGNIPRIPDWTGQARTLGGRTLGDDTAPEPEITVLSVTDAGDVVFTTTVTIDHTDHTLVMTTPATIAEQWLLAGLGAVRAARTALTDPHTDTA